MTVDRTRIGDVELMSLCDSFLEFPAARLFPNVPAKAWEPYRQFLSPGDIVRMQVACFLIRSKGETILVDTGIGAGPVEAFGGIRGRLPEELKARGVHPEEISQVFITHLHSDHVGWNLKKEKAAWRPFFPKARYSVAKLDWEHFHKTAQEPNRAYLKETTTPLLELGIVDLLEGEKALTPEVVAIPAPGHTPGHMALAVVSGKERGLVLADALHVPPQVTHNDWQELGDVDPALAVRTRRKLLERAEREKAVVAVSHFTPDNLGHVKSTGGLRSWHPL